MAKKASSRKSATGKGAKPASRRGASGSGKAKASRKPSAKTTKTARRTAKAKTARKPAAAKAKKVARKVVKKAVKKVAKKAVKKVAKKAVKKTAKKAAAKKKALKKKAPKVRRRVVKNPLTGQERKGFRKLLLAKRRELVGDMTGIEAEALGADRQESKGDISDHPADAGTDNFEQEFSLGLLESERTMLAEIDQALARIERGTYGICLGTGKPIGKARLTARPWAPYSIEYARMVEQGLVRAGERVEPEYLDDEDDDGDEDLESDADPDLDDDEAGDDE